MSDVILTLNAGSSTLKFALFAINDKQLDRIFSGLIEHKNGNSHIRLKNHKGELIRSEDLDPDVSPIDHALTSINDLPGIHLAAISHRLVHGGQHFFDATLINSENLNQLKTLIPLAPLHLPAEIQAIDDLIKRLPNIPQVAYFDTAFHRSISALASMLPLPRRFFDAGIIRYGFHGLSYEYIASQLPENHGRTIVTHLGSGASACGIKDRQSVVHSMGFSTNEGLMMGTRCGSIDPGVILYLLEEEKLSIPDVHKLLFDESGLLGVSGINADIRHLEANDSPHAQQAIDFFCYRTAAEIGKLLPALGGIDSLVFTAGIGENSAQVRQQICSYLEWLGLTIDPHANQNNASVISSSQSKIEIRIIPTDEEIILAQRALVFSELSLCAC